MKVILKKKIKKKKIKFPIVIKPINEGSSLGVYICKNEIQFYQNYKKLKKEYNRILVEEYIPGKEIQAAVMGKKGLGAIELIPRREFYDYKAKYFSSAKTKHIMPAPLSPKKYKEVMFLAKKAHNLLGCKGITRSDFRFFKNKFYLLEINTQPGMTKLSLVPEIANYSGITRSDFKYYDGKFYLLEINTQPGMTSLSLVPEIANYSGIKFEDLVDWVVKDASSNRWKNYIESFY